MMIKKEPSSMKNQIKKKLGVKEAIADITGIKKFPAVGEKTSRQKGHVQVQLVIRIRKTSLQTAM